MQRPSTARITAVSRQLLRPRGGGPRHEPPPCDVFINHRGADTKRNVAGLLHHRLRGLRLRSFLDSESLKPGDRLSEKIQAAIRGCRVGVAIFSPTYCDSYFCLHELSSIMENRKRLVPIFCDVKPSELRVRDDCCRPGADIEKFRSALEEAKCTVGLTFDTVRGDWPEFLESAADAVVSNLIDVEEEEDEEEDIN